MSHATKSLRQRVPSLIVATMPRIVFWDSLSPSDTRTHTRVFLSPFLSYSLSLALCLSRSRSLARSLFPSLSLSHINVHACTPHMNNHTHTRIQVCIISYARQSTSCKKTCPKMLQQSALICDGGGSFLGLQKSG